ncbi:MAG TPA: hypothetical protein VHB48_10705 [Chitinophagaceae bacterium]|nr:hypothetical protein [Chitinophagaceae bacterium]
MNKVLQWLRKYRGAIIAWLVLCCLVMLFSSYTQEKYYLQKDADLFEKNANMVLAVIEAALFCAILVYVFIKKETRNITAGGLVYAVISLAGFFLFFHDTFDGMGLFINRQFNKGVSTKTFVVVAVSDSSKSVDLFYHGKEKEHWVNEWVEEQAYRPGLHQRDSLHLRFAKGLFGVEYFDGVE